MTLQTDALINEPMNESMNESTNHNAASQAEVLENRLAELETRLTFQEHALSELSDALAASRTESMRNAEQLRRVLDELKQPRDAFQANQAEEPPPPHY